MHICVYMYIYAYTYARNISTQLHSMLAPWLGRMPADSHRSASAPPHKATGHRPHKEKPSDDLGPTLGIYDYMQ